ncbi:putative diacylglycerol O-acyltransferase tgs1 [Blastocladiella emersonii ATCC 22665]|nr:putative diacylglycerol O-acyltransferase tgs1 [Blastocladiella emersonii ATCC 22665]
MKPDTQQQKRKRTRRGTRGGAPKDALTTVQGPRAGKQAAATFKSRATTPPIASFSALLPPLSTNDSIPQRVRKYWVRRKQLFSRYDEEIRMDEVGWFSVTPESIAKHLADRCQSDLIVDLFAGVGGNVIQFAETCEQVIGIEIDPVRLACAQHNATVYGVDNRVELVLADAIQWLERTNAQPDVIFLSPPWGGPEYLNQPTFSLDNIPLDWNRLLDLCLAKTQNLAIFLPRNLDDASIQSLVARGLDVEVEEMYTYKTMRAVTVYTGMLARTGGKAAEEAQE